VEKNFTTDKLNTKNSMLYQLQPNQTSIYRQHCCHLFPTAAITQPSNTTEAK